MCLVAYANASIATSAARASAGGGGVARVEPSETSHRVEGILARETRRGRDAALDHAKRDRDRVGVVGGVSSSVMTHRGEGLARDGALGSGAGHEHLARLDDGEERRERVARRSVDEIAERDVARGGVDDGDAEYDVAGCRTLDLGEREEASRAVVAEQAAIQRGGENLHHLATEDTVGAVSRLFHARHRVALAQEFRRPRVEVIAVTPHLLHECRGATAEAKTHAEANLAIHVEEVVEGTVPTHHRAVHESTLDAPKLTREGAETRQLGRKDAKSRGVEGERG